MDHKTLENQLKNCKIREGPLYKRSKFLKQWRERWIVLTMNYLFTFTNKTCKELTDIIDLKQLKSYKSYLRKDDEMIPAGFKVRSDDNEFYFCGRNANQKWSWLVTIERLMDYKYVGSSTYNNIEFIKTRGFISQVEYENGGKVQKKSDPSQISKQQNKKSAQEVKKQVDNEVQKILEELQNQKQQLKIKQLQFTQKQKVFKQQEQSLRKQYEQQVLRKQQQEQAAKKQLEGKEKKDQKLSATTQPNKKTNHKSQVQQSRNQSLTLTQAPSGSLVAQLKNMYEQKMAQSSKELTPSYKLTFDLFKNLKKKSKSDQLSVLRSKTVVNLFQEFHQESPQPKALKFILDFLVKIASDSKYGYYSSIVAEVKSHKNRNYLAQAFIELITDYKDTENTDLLAKFIEICVFQVQGFFNQNQISIIQNKLIDFFLIVQDEQKIEALLKNIFIVNKMVKYQKNEVVKSRLNRMIKEGKREENKNWARKLVDEF